ncbi:twin-arginine translocation pathway signal protein [Sphingobium phenoxybenzoativorans]
MMGLNVRNAALGLALTTLTMAGCLAPVEASAANEAPTPVMGQASAVTQEAKPASPLVPEDFTVPILVETKKFKIVPLGPDLAKVDFKAYMSSIEHLQKTFTRSTDWPHKDISDADAMRDMETEQARFRNRTSFAYAILTPDGSRERGCVYVYPSTVEGYDAVVRLWVTKDEYDAGFDAELYHWVVGWMRKDWPFAKVAYPGRAIDWATWDSAVTANKARKDASERQKN